MGNIFEIENGDLQKLNPHEAVSFVTRLLRAEAFRLGVPITGITISDRINVPDGGIDAEVTCSPSSDLFKPPRTGFQIKTGQFAAWRRAELENEVSDGRGTAHESLKSAIGRIATSGGTYILLCLGCSFTPSQRDDAKGILSSIFQNHGVGSPLVDVFGSDQLVAFVNMHHLPIARSMGGALRRASTDAR